jgi:hypothetical protein
VKKKAKVFILFSVAEETPLRNEKEDENSGYEGSKHHIVVLLCL